MAGESIPGVGRISDAEVSAHRLVESAFREELPARGALGRGELTLVELFSDPMRFKEALTFPRFFAANLCAALFVVERDARTLGEELHGLCEGQVVDLLDE